MKNFSQSGDHIFLGIFLKKKQTKNQKKKKKKKKKNKKKKKKKKKNRTINVKYIACLPQTPSSLYPQ